MQEQDHSELLDRIRAVLSNDALRASVCADYTRTLQQLGIGSSQASELAEEVITRLEGSISDLRGTEAEIYTLFSSTPAANNYIKSGTITDTFADALQRRARAFSGQIMNQMANMKGATIANVSPHHEKLSSGTHGFAVTETDDVDHLSGTFSAVVLNNVLHHEGPERAEEILRSLGPKAGNRLVVVENTTIGQGPQEQTTDRAVQFMHEYLFHRLLQDPATHDTPLPGTYDTAEAWQARIENLGWRLSSRDHHFMDPHHTVMVFDKA